jgi:hypothetical protein
MFGNTHIQVRLAQGIAVIAAAAALLVPAASASPFITDTLAPGGTPASNSRFITDTLLAPGGASVPAVGYRFTTDTLAPGGGVSGVVSVSAGNGFSWADAGIGAVVAAGLMLLALMAHQLVDRRRRGQLAF